MTAPKYIPTTLRELEEEVRHSMFEGMGSLVITPDGSLAQIVYRDILEAGHVMVVGVRYITPWWMNPVLFRKHRFYDDQINTLQLVPNNEFRGARRETPDVAR